MPKELQITNLSFVILARSHNPSLLNPDFLKVNNIIGNDWVTMSPTFSTEQLSQVVFNNGINLALQPDRLTINQDFEHKFDFKDVLLADIASKFLETLPHVNYMALGINPTGHIIFETETELNDFVLTKLLRDGDWKNFNGIQPEVAFSFSYSLEKKDIQVSINDVIVSNRETKEKESGILFSGNIHYDFTAELSLDQKLSFLRERLSLWKNDLDDYYSLVNNCFLKI